MYIGTEYRDFEGNNVEEAIELAQKAFKVTKDKLKIKVVCEESKGLFGMRGAKQAKIKASLK